VPWVAAVERRWAENRSNQQQAKGREHRHPAKRRELSGTREEERACATLNEKEANSAAEAQPQEYQIVDAQHVLAQANVIFCVCRYRPRSGAFILEIAESHLIRPCGFKVGIMDGRPSPVVGEMEGRREPMARPPMILQSDIAAR